MRIKVVFFPISDQGHFVISTAIAKSLLYRNPNSEIYFVVDQEYAGFVKGRPIEFFSHFHLTRSLLDQSLSSQMLSLPNLGLP